MKKVIVSVLCLTIFLNGCSNDDDTSRPQGSCDFIDFKYYNATRDYLGELSNTFILIGVDTLYNDDEIHDFISGVNHFDQSYDYTVHSIGQYKFREIPLKFSSSKNCEEITQIISELSWEPIVAYAHYSMQTDNCENGIGNQMGSSCIDSYGSNFHVKVFDENYLTYLHQMISETNTELVRQNEYMPKWFELRATKESKGDALAMANYFQESGRFEQSEPGISKYPVEY